ncbi:unnamed protein product [Lymnaea stagnalis]|uniref:Uncharacterized protein n=1 Tax=Lymnaea stagnalis TaxID=6523 RepID=A0AAV2HIU6_LYMST
MTSANDNSVESQPSEKKPSYCSFAYCCVLSLLLCIYGVIVGYSITKLVIGGIYFHDCPLQPLLPIFLIVDAIVMLATVSTTQCLTRGRPEVKPKNGQCRTSAVQKAACGIAIMLILFHVAWLICGTIFVNDTRNTMYSPDHCINGTSGPTDLTTTTSHHLTETCLSCHEGLTDFTFVIVIIQWTLVGLVVFGLLIGLCCAFGSYIVCEKCLNFK